MTPGQQRKGSVPAKSEELDDIWQPRLAMLTWDEIAAIPGPSKVVVIPAGATEQHGYHLPFWTDAMNAEAVALDVARQESRAQRTTAKVPVDIGRSLASHGDGCAWGCSAPGDGNR